MTPHRILLDQMMGEAVLSLLLPLLTAHAPAAFEDRLVIVRRKGTRGVRTRT